MRAILWFAVVVINALIIRSRGKKAAAENPELKRGCEKLLRGFLIYMNIPTVALAACEIFGGGYSNCIHLRSGNPFAVGLYLTITALVLGGLIWIYFMGGAEFLTKYPGLVNFNSSLSIRLSYGLIVVGWTVILTSEIISYLQVLE